MTKWRFQILKVKVTFARVLPLFVNFLYTRLKKREVLWEHLQWVGDQAGYTGFPLSKSKCFHKVFIKVGEYVGVNNLSS